MLKLPPVSGNFNLCQRCHQAGDQVGLPATWWKEQRKIRGIWGWHPKPLGKDLTGTVRVCTLISPMVWWEPVWWKVFTSICEEFGKAYHGTYWRLRGVYNDPKTDRENMRLLRWWIYFWCLSSRRFDPQPCRNRGRRMERTFGRPEAGIQCRPIKWPPSSLKPLMALPNSWILNPSISIMIESCPACHGQLFSCFTHDSLPVYSRLNSHIDQHVLADVLEWSGGGDPYLGHSGKVFPESTSAVRCQT
jgi:hypothetical protein